MESIISILESVIKQAPDFQKIEIKVGDVSIKIDKNILANVSSSIGLIGSAPAQIAAPTPVAHVATTPSADKMLKSPIVGTFYSAGSPDAAPFVSVGQKVKKGQVVCIIEAMKTMNEIECEIDGTVVAILAQNGTLVEYGQPLFAIEEA